jgi:hypothetical protein
MRRLGCTDRRRFVQRHVQTRRFRAGNDLSVTSTIGEGKHPGSAVVSSGRVRNRCESR